jgi:hypothetical protein
MRCRFPGDAKGRENILSQGGRSKAPWERRANRPRYRKGCRAAELTDRADHEESIEVRDRLLRMAAHYVHIAESEEWLAAHPISIGSATGLLDKSTPGRSEDDQ